MSSGQYAASVTPGQPKRQEAAPGRAAGDTPLHVHEDAGRAITAAQAHAEPVVLSYIGPDDYPRSLMPLAVQSYEASRVTLSLPPATMLLFDDLGGDGRVGMSFNDALARRRYQLIGHALPGPKPSAPQVGSIVVDVERIVVERIVKVASVEGTVAQEAMAVPTRAALSPVAAVLDIAGLSIYYGSKQAVRDLSLQVLRGEIFGLLGPNGAGKTSTLSAIEGLRKPRTGSISLDGTDVLRRPIEAKAKMGVQLQSTSFHSSLNIKQIVRLFAGLYGARMSEQQVLSTIASIGLEAEANKPFRQLSGGQQQRLALQVAVVHKPVLLLLDEPTAGLDPQARRQLWGRIEGLRQDGGSILLTTHSMEEAQAVCDRVAIMDHGTILTCGSPQELIDRHRDDPSVQAVAHGVVTLDDVFVGLTGSQVRD